MEASLVRGQRFVLSSKEILACVSWNTVDGSLGYVDCDVGVILCGEDGKVIQGSKLRENVAYYANPIVLGGAVRHQCGEMVYGFEEEEQVLFSLEKIHKPSLRMVIVANVYGAVSKHLHFGLVNNIYIKLVDISTLESLCSFNLSNSFAGRTGLVLGEIYQLGNVWKFNAIGQALRGTNYLIDIVRTYL